MSNPQFQPIPQILVNSSNNIFGGYIYSADYSISYGNEGTSSIIINAINSSGNYSVTNSSLRLDQPYQIQLGSNIQATMYLKRYKISNTTSGKILELEFIDGSFILDQFYVGLYKRHGQHNTCPSELANESVFTSAILFGTPKDCIITVGREHHPCDRYYTGAFDNITTIEDPCHPCFRDAYEVSQDAITLVNCVESVKYQILPIVYNFDILLCALRTGLPNTNISSPPNPNPLYFESYTGTVREVLSHWCSDFGWIFYWTQNPPTITFRDLRTVINVNAQINQFCPNISTYENEATLDGTVSSVIITNYNREGRGKQRYTCQDAIHIDVPPYNQNTARSGSLAVTQTVKENAAAWALYSDKLRTLFYWFAPNYLGGYGLDDMGSMQAGMTIPELGLIMLSNPLYVSGNTSTATGLGDGFATIGVNDIPVERDDNLGIVPFLEASVDGDLADVQTAIEANDNFSACFQLLTPEDQWRLAANMNGKYFFVALHNPQLEQKFQSDEVDYARGLWGQYYVFQPGGDFWENEMFINDNPGCSSTSFKKDGTVSWQALELAGASFSFLNNQAPGEPPVSLSSLPFAKFLAAFKDGNYSPPDHINFKLAMIQKSGEEWNPSPGELDPSEPQLLTTDPRNNVRNRRFVDAAWTYAPRKLQTYNDENGANVITDILQIGVNQYSDKEKAQICIFLGSSGTGITTTVENSTNDKAILSKPFSGKPLNPNDTTDPNLQEFVIYEYPNLKCLPIGNEGDYCRRFTMNVPGLYTLMPDTDFFFDAPVDSNYGFVIEKTKMRNQKLRKVETIMQTGSCANDLTQTLNTNVVYQPIDDHTIQDIARLNTSSGPSSICTYDLNAIEAVHNNFVQNLSLNQTTPLIKKTFVVEGIDINGPQPTIDSGLLAMKITTGPDGIRTTYTFGTTKMKVPEKPEVFQLGLMKQLQYMGSLGETFGPGILSATNGIIPPP